MDKNKEQLELKDKPETQERVPDVSDDAKKESEVNTTMEKTEIVLANLKQKIETIKHSERYSYEIKNQAKQIEKELESSSDDKEILSVKAGEIAALEKQQTEPSAIDKRLEESGINKVWAKITSVFTAIGAFFAGKKTWSELKDELQ